MLDLYEIAPFIDLEYFLKYELGLNYVRNCTDDFKIECINPFHVDTNPSAYINKTNLKYHCFGCHDRGNLVTMIERLKDLTEQEAEDYLIHFAGLDITDRECRVVRNRPDLPQHKEYQLSFNYRRDWSKLNCNYIRTFVQDRKFDLELFSKTYIGYNEKLRSVTIPIIHGTSIVNIAERYIFPADPSEKIKYKKDSLLSLCMWGLFEDYNQVKPVFCEGVFDAIRLRSAGFNAFAVLSNQLPKMKKDLLMAYFPAGDWTLVPDNDDGGKEMIQQWRSMLNYTSVKVGVITNHKDPDQMTKQDILTMMDNRINLLDMFIEQPKQEQMICNTVRR